MKNSRSSRASVAGLELDLVGASVESALGPPDSIFRATAAGNGDHSMWAYQRRGLYLYFHRDRLVAWRSYPHGCDHPPPARSRRARPDDVPAASSADSRRAP